MNKKAYICPIISVSPYINLAHCLCQQSPGGGKTSGTEFEDNEGGTGGGNGSGEGDDDGNLIKQRGFDYGSIW